MWAQLVNVLAGLWLMVSPSLLHLDGSTADNAYITGPIIIAMAAIASSQAVRNLRYVNIACGLWLLAAPWLLSYMEMAGYINDSIIGLVVILLSLVKGRLTYSFGGGWRSLFKQDPPFMEEASRQEREGQMDWR